jgi:uncharacterized protein (TIGR02391 family)
MPSHPLLPASGLESICRVLADTVSGLSGNEIDTLLERLGIPSPTPGITKWKRLLAALTTQQERDGCSNRVLQFIIEAMQPVRYVGKSSVFQSRQRDLNEVLIFCGMELGDDGKLRLCDAAKTLTEAESRAGRLRAELMKRNVHADVLHFCRAELLTDNYFHAVLEATKSVSEKIRLKTGLEGDGADLADKALAMGKAGMPLLAFNTLRTESEQSEQRGLVNLMKGMFGTFRNTTAHAPKVSWSMTEQDALDLLTMASFLHRRLDLAYPTNRAP